MAVYLLESKADRQKLIDHVGEDLADLYFRLRDRMHSPENDLYYWLTRSPEDLRLRLRDISKRKSRRERDKAAAAGADLIYRKDGWRVYNIKSYDASMKYGKNTRWCISGSKSWQVQGEDHFHNYLSRGLEIYYYLNDTIGSFAVLYNPSNGGYQVYNARNLDITERDLSMLPNVPGLPVFSYSGVYYYTGIAIAPYLKDRIDQVSISSDINVIPEDAFNGCDSLVTISIPASIRVIGSNAFKGCFMLDTVHYYSSQDAWNEINIAQVGNEALLSANIIYEGR